MLQVNSKMTSVSVAIRPSTPTSITDPYFRNVVLLARGLSVNNGNNTTYVESSGNNLSITKIGTPSQGTFSPYSENYGVEFNTSSDYLVVPYNATNHNLGFGDYTLEYFVFHNQVKAGGGMIGPIIGYSGTSIHLFSQIDGSIGVTLTGSMVQIQTAANIIKAQTWQHIALVRLSGNTTLYVDGVSVGTYNSAYDSRFCGINGTHIGYCYGSGNLVGVISNLRLVKGNAQYTGAFTPPSTMLQSVSGTVLLTCQKNRLIDVSSTTTSVTQAGSAKVTALSPFSPSSEYTPSVHGGSAYFNGTTDYLTTTSPSGFNLSNGDFTIEAWYYPISTTNQVLFQVYDPSSGTKGSSTSIGLQWSQNTSNYYKFNLLGGAQSGIGSYLVAGTKNYPLYSWCHVSVVRQGGTLSLYVNGALDASYNISSGTYNAKTGISIGKYIGNTGDGDAYVSGLISDFRFIKGTALYTTGFVPTSSPLSSITNTQMLLSFRNQSIQDYSKLNDMITVGSSFSSTTTKYGTGSIKGATSSAVVIPNSSALDISNCDFTLEGWVYFNSSVGWQSIYTKRVSNANFGGTAQITLDGNNKLQFGLTKGTIWDVQLQSTGVPPTNTWIHFAAVRAGTSVKWFINGTLNASGTLSGTLYTNTSDVIIGANGTTTLGEPLNGYVDEIRLTKGIARYTSNFTPPTTKLGTK